VLQMRFPLESLAMRTRDLAAIAGVGIAATLFASYFAAQRIGALDPLEFIRPREQRPTIAIPRLLAIWGVLVVASIVALVIQVRLHSLWWGNIGSTIWNASVFVIAIPFVVWCAPHVLRVLAHAIGAVGRVAGESLFRSPARTGVTVAAIAGVLTIAVTVASLTASFRRSVASYYED